MGTHEGSHSRGGSEEKSMPVEDYLKLRHFRLIVAIHEFGSVRRAADQIGISQPAASSALREVEDILGVKLFTRSRTGTTATVYGKTLVRRGRILLSNVRNSVEEIMQSRSGIAGEVKVGIFPASAMTILPDAIRVVTETRPAITLRVMEGTLGQLLPPLERGELEMIIGRLPSPSFLRT